MDYEPRCSHHRLFFCNQTLPSSGHTGLKLKKQVSLVNLNNNKNNNNKRKNTQVIRGCSQMYCPVLT